MPATIPAENLLPTQVQMYSCSVDRQLAGKLYPHPKLRALEARTIDGVPAVWENCGTICALAARRRQLIISDLAAGDLLVPSDCDLGSKPTGIGSLLEDRPLPELLETRGMSTVIVKISGISQVRRMRTCI